MGIDTQEQKISQGQVVTRGNNHILLSLSLLFKGREYQALRQLCTALSIPLLSRKYRNLWSFLPYNYLSPNDRETSL